MIRMNVVIWPNEGHEDTEDHVLSWLFKVLVYQSDMKLSLHEPCEDCGFLLNKQTFFYAFSSNFFKQKNTNTS